MTDQLLDRLARLLAKAESTDSPAEADALVAKAQQLATTHAIDLASARRRAAGNRRRTAPTQRTRTLAAPNRPHRRHLVALYAVCAHANDVVVDVSRASTVVIGFGFADDLDVVDALYGSLVTQMVGGANAAIRRGDHNDEVVWHRGEWRTVDARVYRSSFYRAFVSRIAARLDEARADAVAAHDAGDHAGAESAALVLASKGAEVTAFHAESSEARGTWRGPRRRRGDGHSRTGAAAGDAAGRAARMGTEAAVRGTRGELA